MLVALRRDQRAAEIPVAVTMTLDEFGDNGAQRVWNFDRVRLASESSSVEALMVGISAVAGGHGDDRESVHG